MLAVTQFILIAVVYVISFIPPMLVLNDVVQNELMMYFYFINHISNFFIYLAVSKEFRKETKNLVNTMRAKVRFGNPQTVFSLQ